MGIFSAPFRWFKNFFLMFYIPITIVWIITSLGGRFIGSTINEGLGYLLKNYPNAYKFIIGIDLNLTGDPNLDIIGTLLGFIYFFCTMLIFLWPIIKILIEFWNENKEAPFEWVNPTFRETSYHFVQITKKIWLFIFSLRGLASLFVILGLIQLNYFLYTNHVHSIGLDFIERWNPALIITDLFFKAIGWILFAVIKIMIAGFKAFGWAGDIISSILEPTLLWARKTLITEGKTFLLQTFSFNLKPTLLTFATSLFKIHLLTYFSVFLKIVLGALGIYYLKGIIIKIKKLFGKYNPLKKTLIGTLPLTGTIEDAFIILDVETDYDDRVISLLTQFKKGDPKAFDTLQNNIDNHSKDQKVIEFYQKLTKRYPNAKEKPELIMTAMKEIKKRYDEMRKK